MDPEKRRGMFYYEYVCGVKCRFGEIVMIEKTERRWTIRNSVELWIE
jgi:hypothetical protein